MPVTPRETRKKEDETLIPQNLEAEEAVLGAILVNPETLAKVSDTLLPKSFYKPAHRYMKQCSNFSITMTTLILYQFVMF